MKLGDLVRTSSPISANKKWWWMEKVGILVRPALPKIGRGEKTPCWHVLIGTRTANLDEHNLEILNEAR